MRGITGQGLARLRPARQQARRGPAGLQGAAQRRIRAALPALTLLILLVAASLLSSRAISYIGFTLMLNLAVPIALATVAQVMFLAINDLDLSIGAFVGLVACISATWLHDTPLLGAVALLGCIALYAAVGALVQLRALPSIVVTLGMSFVWLGLAILILPEPGGTAPDWLANAMSWRPPYVPLPILLAVAIAAMAHLLLVRSSWGTILRGMGGNDRALARSGWSVLRARVTLYALAGCFGVASGLALVGITTSADANMAGRYTLLSIAGAILGGSEFFGGLVAPAGAVVGALALALAGSVLTFMHLAADWQVGAQGVILVVVLALRALVAPRETR